MESRFLIIGRRYGFREKRSDSDLIKVKLLDKVGRKGKVKIVFEEGPHPGLEEYVNTRQIVVPWGERKALLRDEKRLGELLEYSEPRSDRALAAACSAVLEATGEPGAWAGEAVTSMDERELQRILDRSGLDGSPSDLHPLGFCDRHGEVHLPLDAVVGLAQAFAAAEPRTVVECIDDQEEELRLKGNQPGDRWYHQYLREQMPGFAIARQWAGLEQEAEMLRKEIARLRSLVSTAAYELKRSGAERKGNSLLRALEGR